MNERVKRSAVVTGAGGGIGRAIALRLADDGYDVGILDVDEAGAGETAEKVRAAGRQGFVEVGSVTKESDVRRCVDGLAKSLGSIDLLVNNAGVARLGKFLDSTDDDWRDVFAVNVDGMVRVTRAVLPGMIGNGGGNVVNMASWCGKKGLANYSVYCASKFAVIGLTQSLALEMAEHGIRVNAVCPGFIVDTKMRDDYEAVREQQGLPTSSERISRIPLARAGYPDDVAKLVAFLASDQSDYMTGQSINVTGGLWVH